MNAGMMVEGHESSTELVDLDGFEQHGDLGEILEKFQQTIQQPEVFIAPPEDLSKVARAATKALYDFTASKLTTLNNDGVSGKLEGKLAFKKLHVVGFDSEQIWGQIENLSGVLKKRTKRLMKKMGPDVRLLKEEVENEIDDLLNGGESDTDGSQEGLMNEEGSQSDQDELDGSDSSDEDDLLAKPDTKRRRVSDNLELENSAHPVEDAFMRLEDMENFVQEAERGEMQQNEENFDLLGEGDDGYDSELNALLEGVEPTDSKLKKMGENDENGEKSEGLDKQGDEIMFDDFFGGKPSKVRNHSSKKSGGDLKGGDVEEYSVGGAGDDILGLSVQEKKLSSNTVNHKLNDVNGKLSTHERESAKLAEQILRLEEEAISEKPWPLRGEVGASDRPINSVLEMDLDFDTTVRPPPEPTVESTKSLEDIIKKRVADFNFDDVVRIVPPPLEEKKTTLELDDSKAQQGLGELYESEYVRQVTGGGAVDKDESVRLEARKLFKDICVNLDALTHFHFAPKPILEDMEVKVDVPAIAMEEALPMGVSNANIRAPEEIYRSQVKGGELRGDTELTREDRKRSRAKKKRIGKAKQEQKDAERVNKAVGSGGVAPVKGRKSLVKEGKKKQGKSEGGVDYGSSRSVFAKLQADREGGGPQSKGKKTEEGPRVQPPTLKL